MSKKKFLILVSILTILSMLIACAPAATPAPIPPTAAPQIVEVTKMVAGTPVVEQVVVTATAAPTVNPFDPAAKIEVWIDAAREESAGKFATKYPDQGKLVQLTTTD